MKPLQDVVLNNGRLLVFESLEVPLVEMKEAFTVQEAEGASSYRRVTIEAIHEGVTRNFHEFSAENLKKALKSWTSPYKKPVLKDHMTSGYFMDAPPPLGRVQSAKFVESVLKRGVMAHQLELLITDREAIERIDDERYLTLSVGASVDEVYCSICGAELLQSRALWDHEHARGKKYKGKTATWVLSGIEFNEVSFVNVPADPHAQVLSVVPDDGTQADDSAAEEVSQGLEDRNDDKVKVLESLDELAGVEEDAVTEPPQQDLGDQEQENTDSAGTSESSGDEDDRSVDFSELLRPLQEGLASVQADMSLANEAIAELTQRITALESQYDELAQNAGETQQALLAQNVELAKFAREQMAERLADLTYLTGECQADEWDQVYQDALTLKSKDLAVRLKEALQDAMARGPRPIVRVEPQGLATKTKFDASDEDELPKEEELTVDDLAKAFVNRLSSYKH